MAVSFDQLKIIVQKHGGSSVKNVICDDTVFMFAKNIYENSKQ